MANRFHQALLIASTIVSSWLAMQDVHELGHVLGAWATGGRVARVVLSPLAISRTDLAENPQPLLVTWAGPMLGVVLPLLLWGLVAAIGVRGAFVFRFFAGFCLVANGLYLGVGSFGSVGDCGELLRHGAPAWRLWLFGAIAAPAGLWLWSGQGKHFGLGDPQGKVDRRVAYGCCAASLALLILGILVGGR